MDNNVQQLANLRPEQTFICKQTGLEEDAVWDKFKLLLKHNNPATIHPNIQTPGHKL